MTRRNILGKIDVSAYPFDSILRPEDGIERICRNVVYFLEYYVAS